MSNNDNDDKKFELVVTFKNARIERQKFKTKNGAKAALKLYEAFGNVQTYKINKL
jgi:hypothetical protein